MSHYEGVNRQALAAHDRGFCGVASIAAVLFCGYKRAATLAEQCFGRVHRKGTAMYSLEAWQKFAKVTGRKVEMEWVAGDKRGLTLGNFASHYPQGRYVVLVKRHAVGFRNGINHDWTANGAGRRKVQCIIKIGN